MSGQATARLAAALAAFEARLDALLGWRDYRRERIRYLIDYEHVPFDDAPWPGEFALPEALARGRAVALPVSGLFRALDALRASEALFRRGPRTDAPLARANHLDFACRCYFGGVLELKDRLKASLNAVRAERGISPEAVGALVREFEIEFRREIRAARGGAEVERFTPGEIADALAGAGLVPARLYSRAARGWAERVRERAEVAGEYMERAAALMLSAGDPFAL